MWLTLFVMGLAGSLHCLGMCSPLVMAVAHVKKPYLINRVLYNAGRIVTYGIQGAVIAGVGSMIHFQRFQNGATIVLGVVMVIIGIMGIRHITIPFLTRMLQHIMLRMKVKFSDLLHRKTLPSVTLMGMLNGILPCGLTYFALTYCLTLSSVVDGFLLMVCFGLGTLPVMLGFTSVVQALVKRFHFSFSHISTFVMIFLGILLIVRSVNWHAHEVMPENSEAIIICR